MNKSDQLVNRERAEFEAFGAVTEKLREHWLARLTSSIDTCDLGDRNAVPRHSHLFPGLEVV
jgi:hypothetical protein